MVQNLSICLHMLANSDVREPLVPPQVHNMFFRLQKDSPNLLCMVRQQCGNEIMPDLSTGSLNDEPPLWLLTSHPEAKITVVNLGRRFQPTNVAFIR